MSAGATNFDIFINGEQVKDDHVHRFDIERDVNQPDMCTVVLTNQNAFYTSKVKIAQPLKIDVGSDQTTIWEGEIVGIEPIYSGKDKTTVVIRGMNKLHKFTRGKVSKTFTKKSDKEILQEILTGMDLDFTHPKAAGIKYEHVYQHNQTPLEFARTRIGRIGAHFWCVGSKVFVKWPDFQQDSGIKLSVNPGQDSLGLLEFYPRMSSHAVVKKVTVKGWNPETKELITGTASAQSSKLGSTNAKSGAGAHGDEETFQVDQPIWSKEEADLLAEAHLKERSITYVTGTAKTTGSSKFDLGQVFTVDVDASGKKDPFSGKYYILGLTHHYVASGKDGFQTTLRFARDAQDA